MCSSTIFAMEFLKYVLPNIHTIDLQYLAMEVLLEFILLFYLEVNCSTCCYLSSNNAEGIDYV